MENNFSKGKAWIVDVSMGYGHQRTAFPLRHLAPEGEVIHANDYEDIPGKDKKIWQTSRKFYDFISRFKKLPLVGEAAFGLFDISQKIYSFYPTRDLSKPSFLLKQSMRLIKKGWGKDLIKRLAQNPLSFVTTFFTPAQMADYFKYPGEIYCVVCDADISRTWAPSNPSKSKVKYFTPNLWTANRLKLYGVQEKNIFFTGYPLPLENIGKDLEIVKKDLRERLFHLDPEKTYFQQYKVLVEKHLDRLPKKSIRPLTLMFAVGGAGAQKELAIKIAKSLKKKIHQRKLRLILVAGIRNGVNEYFIEQIKLLGLEDCLGSSLKIIFAPTVEEYFKKFNMALRETDVLWTKPSELSFYTGLGLPMIIAPTIGSQEEFNRKWLLSLGSGVLQEDPDYVDEWLFDFLDSGRLAEAAMQGFIEVGHLGSLKIEKIISKKK